jgi:hypothetical protein
MQMAENNPPAISPGIPEPAPITNPDGLPDMDVMEWAKKHIDAPERPEIPNLLALLSVDTIAAGKRPERKVPRVKKIELKPAKKTVNLKANRVAALFANLEKLADPGQRNYLHKRDGVNKNALRIDRLTAPGFTDYHLKEARGMIEAKAEGSGFSYLEGEISRLRILVEDLTHRLSDLERERGQF